MDGDYCYRCESPVSMCMCEETITGKAEWQRWCRGRIAELEADNERLREDEQNAK